MEQFLAEEKGLKVVSLPQSLIGSTVGGARVSLSNQERVAFLVQLGASASAVLTATLKQHSASSGGVTKDLEVSNPYFHKLDAETSFSKVEVSVAAAAFDIKDLTGLANGGLVVFEVLQEDVDVNGNFSHVSLDLLGDATARVIAVSAIGAVDRKPAYELAL